MLAPLRGCLVWAFFQPRISHLHENCLALSAASNPRLSKDFYILDHICGPREETLMSSKSRTYRNSGHPVAAKTQWDRQNFWFLFPLNTESIFFCQKLKLAKLMTAEQLSGFLLKSIKCLSDSVYDRWHFISLPSPMPFWSPLKIDFNLLHCCFSWPNPAYFKFSTEKEVSALPSSLILSHDRKGSDNTPVFTWSNDPTSPQVHCEYFKKGLRQDCFPQL